MSATAHLDRQTPGPFTAEPRRALVTGAGGGIGGATARRLARAGYEVYVLDKQAEAAAAVVDDILASGGKASSLVLDLSDDAAIVSAAAEIAPCEVLVNNAGIFAVRNLFDITVEEFRTTCDVNVVSLFLLTREMAKRMPRGSRIVNTSSRAAFGGSNFAHYAASKAAVIGLTRALAIDLAPLGIVVNAVAPGAVDTQMVRSRQDTDLSAMLAVQLVKRLADPDEIARAIEFLASPDAGYITGQVLVVDGGRSLCGPLGL